MGSSSIKLPKGLAGFAGALLCLGSLGMTATAQDVTKRASPAATHEAAASSTGPGPEANVLQRLAAYFKSRRSDLDARHQALARDLDVLSALARPAARAEYAALRQRIGTADRLARDVADLQALIRELTRETLQEMSRRELGMNVDLEPSPALSRTGIDVNLRAVPDGLPFEVLKADSLVVRLSTDDSSGWNLVATPHGFGFVPESQLQLEP